MYCERPRSSGKLKQMRCNEEAVVFEATKKATALVILYRIAGDDPFCPPQIRKDDNRVDSIVVFYKGGELFRAFGTAVSA